MDNIATVIREMGEYFAGTRLALGNGRYAIVVDDGHMERWLALLKEATKEESK